MHQGGRYSCLWLYLAKKVDKLSPGSLKAWAGRSTHSSRPLLLLRLLIFSFFIFFSSLAKSFLLVSVSPLRFFVFDPAQPFPPPPHPPCRSLFLSCILVLFLRYVVPLPSFFFSSWPFFFSLPSLSSRSNPSDAFSVLMPGELGSRTFASARQCRAGMTSRL